MTHFMELALMIMEPRRFKTCSVGWQAGGAGDPVFRFHTEGNLLENPLLLRKASHFLFLKLIEWGSLILWKAICFTQCFKYGSHPKTFSNSTHETDHYTR